MSKSEVPPVLRAKWEQSFRSADIDGDGVWTKKDVQLIQDKLKKDDSKVPAKLRQDKIKETNDFFVQYLGAELKDTTTKEQFIQRMQQLLEQGKMKDVVTARRSRIFEIIDGNADGKIDFNQFKFEVQTATEARGKTYDAPYLERVFKALDVDGDGQITRKEYLDAFVTYMTDTTVTLEQLPVFGLPQ